MDRWILTAICLGALGFAGALSWRWRDLERAEHEPLSGGWAGARRALRTIAVMVDTTWIVGILVAGLGGRLFMRIIAATSSDTLRGVRTDADEPIGRVSTGGTIALIVFGGILATIAVAIAHRLLRRWLPARGWQAGVVTAVLGLGLLGEGIGLLTPTSKDFRILSPLVLAVGMVVALTLAVGASYGAIYEGLDRRIPELGRGRGRGSLAYLPILGIAILPPILVAMVSVVALGAVAPTIINWWHENPVAQRAGTYLVGAAGALAIVVNGMRIAEILG